MWDKIQNMKAANMDHNENDMDNEMEQILGNTEDVSAEDGADGVDDAEMLEPVEAIEPDVLMVALDDPREQKRLIEALLFASPEPVTLRSIQNRLPSTADVGGILLELQDEYIQRGINLVRLEDAWAFRTAADVGPYLVLTKKEEKKLSRAALETLAVISYHQPVTRAEIENIRGVATNKGTLDVLLEAGWIKPGRRRESPGRPVTWITTTQFLDEFGISQLTDLPGLQEMKASGLLDTRPAIDTIPGAADLFASGDATPPQGSGEDGDDGDSPDQPLGEFDQITDEANVAAQEILANEATDDHNDHEMVAEDDAVSDENQDDNMIEDERESA